MAEPKTDWGKQLQDDLSRLEEIVSSHNSETQSQLNSFVQQLTELLHSVSSTNKDITALSDKLTYVSEGIDTNAKREEQDVARLEASLTKAHANIESNERDLTKWKKDDFQAWRDKVEVLRNGVPWAAGVITPVIIFAFVWTHYDFSSLKKQYEQLYKTTEEVAGKLPAVDKEIDRLRLEIDKTSSKAEERFRQIVQERSQLLSASVEGLEERLNRLKRESAMLDDVLFTSLDKAEMELNNHWAIFVGPFDNAVNARFHIVNKLKLEREFKDDKYLIIRSFEKKGEFLVGIADSMAPNKAECESKLKSLPTEFLKVEESSFAITEFPVKLRSASCRRILKIVGQTRPPAIQVGSLIQQFVNVKIPDPLISNSIPETVTTLNSTDDLSQIINAPDFDKAKCEKFIVVYYDIPENISVRKCSLETIKKLND